MVKYGYATTDVKSSYLAFRRWNKTELVYGFATFNTKHRSSRNQNRQVEAMSQETGVGLVSHRRHQQSSLLGDIIAPELHLNSTCCLNKLQCECDHTAQKISSQT